MKKMMLMIFSLALAACAAKIPEKPDFPTSIPTTITAPTFTPSPSPEPCAFMEASSQLPEISSKLLQSLKQSGLHVESARAEAYGENCVNQDGSIASFSARETDFYINITAPDIQNKSAMGSNLETILGVIAGYPIKDTPGPNPGYIGVNFTQDKQSLPLWFLRQKASNALANGVKGADLFTAVSNNP